ncbi:hypothetical protein DE146DRAFT_647070 [Phaeosphaeria sp. MPI-PUGE-AT-0046c]|nr:hypothetical protein DE146DRAFT_647070 [Phaeosphaeria sp. MPI-PUGE-AT-0046c]
MALSEAHLLRIPREIRDRILYYVHHEVSFPWTFSTSRKRRLTFEVTIPYAPRLSVLLSCSRLCEEYMQQPLNKSMVVHWVGSVKRRIRGKALEKHTKYKKACSRVENITLAISLGDEEGLMPRSDDLKLDCHLTEKCINFFKPHISQLSSVIVISRKLAVEHAWDRWRGNRVGTMRAEEASTGPVPDYLEGLQLVYFSRALCLYSLVETRTWDNEVKDSIYQLQVRYYASESHQIRHPTPEQMQVQFKSYTIKDRHRSERRRLGKQDLEAINNVASRMWGWEELIGEDVYKSSEVVRTGPTKDDEQSDVGLRVNQEDEGDSEHYFNWEETMMDTRHDGEV